MQLRNEPADVSLFTVLLIWSFTSANSTSSALHKFVHYEAELDR